MASAIKQGATVSKIERGSTPVSALQESRIMKGAAFCWCASGFGNESTHAFLFLR